MSSAQESVSPLRTSSPPIARPNYNQFSRRVFEMHIEPVLRPKNPVRSIGNLERLKPVHRVAAP